MTTINPERLDRLKNSAVLMYTTLLTIRDDMSAAPGTGVSIGLVELNQILAKIEGVENVARVI